MNLTALKAECVNNPNNYSATASGWTKTLSQWFAEDAYSICADILNTVRPGLTVPKSSVSKAEVLDAMDLPDFLAITAINAQLAARVPPAGPISETLMGSWFESELQLDGIQLRKWNGAASAVIDTRTLANIKLFLVNGSSTENRLRALGQRDGTRGEQLAAPTLDYVVTALDVQNAKALP